MRKYIAFHPDYNSEITSENSQHPEDFFTTAAISKPGAGTRPLFTIKSTLRDKSIMSPVISTGKFAQGDLDDPIEQEPEAWSKSHPYMNPTTRGSWGCNSRNWWGYNRSDWDRLKFGFYTKYHPDIVDDWLKMRQGPSRKDFVDHHGQTQSAWDAWNEASQNHQIFIQQRAARGELADPHHVFRNALYNVAELYHTTLAKDGRNYPGREMQSDLKKFFKANPHLRTPNVDWATEHLEKLKNGVEDYRAGSFNDVHKDLTDKLTGMGFKTRFSHTDPRGFDENRGSESPSLISPSSVEAKDSFLWMPNRREPYGIHIKYHYNPLASEDNRHQVSILTFQGSSRKAVLAPVKDIDSILPNLMSETESKVGNSDRVHKGLVNGALGLPVDEAGRRVWGFRGGEGILDFGSSPSEFEHNFWRS